VPFIMPIVVSLLLPRRRRRPARWETDKAEPLGINFIVLQQQQQQENRQDDHQHPAEEATHHVNPSNRPAALPIAPTMGDRRRANSSRAVPFVLPVVDFRR
jgi:hypothetical protein